MLFSIGLLFCTLATMLQPLLAKQVAYQAGKHVDYLTNDPNGWNFKATIYCVMTPTALIRQGESRSFGVMTASLTHTPPYRYASMGNPERYTSYVYCNYKGTSPKNNYSRSNTNLCLTWYHY